MIFGITIGVGVLGIILYIVVTAISTGLHDFKYLFFLNGKSILKAVIIADIYTIFNNFVIKAVASVDIVTTTIISVVCVSLSITAAMLYDRSHLREMGYQFIVTIYDEQTFNSVARKLWEHHIPFFANKGLTWSKHDTQMSDRWQIQVITFTKQQSKNLRSIIKEYPKKEVKYIKFASETSRSDVLNNNEITSKEKYTSW